MYVIFQDIINAVSLTFSSYICSYNIHINNMYIFNTKKIKVGIC